jgi:hypothetical protein
MNGTRKSRQADNAAFRADHVAQLRPEIVEMMGNGNHVLSDRERIAELEEAVTALEADNEKLEAENRRFEEMKAQWLAGGFEAVIAGKDEEIRALLTRVASESREKAKNLRSADHWKAQAVKLGYRREDRST